jgi:hypothetical protein
LVHNPKKQIKIKKTNSLDKFIKSVKSDLTFLEYNKLKLDKNNFDSMNKATEKLNILIEVLKKNNGDKKILYEINNNCNSKNPSYNPVFRIAEGIYRGMRTYKIMEYANVKMGTLKKYKERLGVDTLPSPIKYGPIDNHGNGLSIDKICLIVKSHELELNQKESAEYANVTQRTVSKWLSKLGLNEDNYERTPTTIEQEYLILVAHDLKMTLEQAKTYVGLNTTYPVRRIWKENNLKAHNSRI